MTLRLRTFLIPHFSIALDGIQDPGNLGTIIRIADWFGIDTIYCSPDTADAYAPKVVQATMGSLARVHIIYTDLPALLDALPPTYPVYGTLLDGQDIYAQQLTPEGIIVMGNEGNGISAPVRQRVNRPLLIPCFRQGDSAESLNVAVATAITCSEFRRNTVSAPSNEKGWTKSFAGRWQDDRTAEEIIEDIRSSSSLDDKM